MTSRAILGVLVVSSFLAAAALALVDGCRPGHAAAQEAVETERDLVAGPRDAATHVNGLAVMVNFTDFKFAAAPSEVAAMMNQDRGFTGWGNAGSVSQYYAVQSDGHLLLKHQVVSVTLDHPANYYTSAATFDAGTALARDAVAAVHRQFPAGFTGLTKSPSGNQLQSLVLLVTRPGGAGVSYGFDPAENIAVLNDGVWLPVVSTALVGFEPGKAPAITAVCHELGHHLFGWADYDFPSPSSSNLGHYCLMGSGGHATHPMPIDPALRLQRGWIDTVTEITRATAIYTVTANSRSQIFKYTNPRNPKEYYLVEALHHGRAYAPVDGDGHPTDEGLAIWYVDESWEPNPTRPRIELVQADGRDDLADVLSQSQQALRGDLTDLFDHTLGTFDHASHPMFGWKDGTPTRLSITDVSAPGATMTFTVKAEPMKGGAAQGDRLYLTGHHVAERGKINQGRASQPRR